MSATGTLLFLLLWAVLLAGALSIVVSTLRTGAPPMPSPPRVRRALLAMLPRDLTGTVLELGAGWGDLAFPLADRCPQARVIAYERSWLPFLFMRLRMRFFPRANLTLRRQDFFRASFQDASCVLCYLSRGHMTRLAPRFAAELPEGALILSHTFSLRGWTPARTVRLDDLYRTPVYLYVVPPREQAR
ncbi:class I SAM-dependent methyltransferase [Corallococcus terminator]|uniref:SAM-dependent methyltransferase n=1 Tax=Corallococcus terminator TaxID=2316733 RepID=A0A3A8HST6_9BACT|nr:class I SAM-dependent methyltransferase [Corallococcus terminator]RKG73885.1 SAM-dependent methyltransferase [Corallococcus terminator]